MERNVALERAVGRTGRIYDRLSARARARFSGRRAELGAGVRFGGKVRCQVDPGGRLVIGGGVEIGSLTTIAVGADGDVTIGPGVFISANCTIAARGKLTIGRDTMIAELVSIRDHDHDPSKPPKSGAVIQSDVTIGERVWIGSKASVIRGGAIGDDAVIGAHALVNSQIPPNSLAVGVPARVKRTGLRTDD